MVFSKEFKEAIAELPSKEKDKLIMRLLRRDLDLANRLYFELIDTRTIDDRRLEMEARVTERAKQIGDRYYSPGYLMMEMRYLSGEINEHVRITKDKFGEISLNLLMLGTVLNEANLELSQASFSKANKCCVYIIARAFKILVMIDKLHNDYRMEFEEGLQRLGILIGENRHLMNTAIHHGLDVNWLIRAEIPEEVSDIHKDLRARGYLK